MDENLKDTYTVWVNCGNCGKTEQREIPRGKEVFSESCRNCGCSGVTRTENPNKCFEYRM